MLNFCNAAKSGLTTCQPRAIFISRNVGRPPPRPIDFRTPPAPSSLLPRRRRHPPSPKTLKSLVNSPGDVFAFAAAAARQQRDAARAPAPKHGNSLILHGKRTALGTSGGRLSSK